MLTELCDVDEEADVESLLLEIVLVEVFEVVVEDFSVVLEDFDVVVDVFGVLVDTFAEVFVLLHNVDDVVLCLGQAASRCDSDRRRRPVMANIFETFMAAKDI